MTNKALRIAQPSARQLLTRLLEDPSLIATVQNLEPRSLGKVIRHIGLEDCGEIVCLATTEQIKHVFDDDLWKSERPGKDESFDAERFGIWLEVMLEAGEDFVAEKLAELPEDFVTFALHRHILVINVEDLRVEMDAAGEDADLTDKALESCLYQEINEYQVISRRHDGWDTILVILLALDKNDHALLERILERCCHMSREYIEDNGGLYEVLTSSEMLEDDVAGEREDRRAREGFIAPSAAASFLNLARTVAPSEVAGRERDAVTRAYFRDLAPAKPAGRQAAARSLKASSSDGASSAVEIEALIGELDEAEMPRNAKPLFVLAGKAGKGESGTDFLFSQALAELATEDPAVHGQRLDELAYLCNVLVAGCAFDRRAFRPVEAVVAVAAACNLGLELLLKEEKAGNKKSAARAARIVARDGADKAFRVGFGLLHGEVATAAAKALERVLATSARKATDAETRRQIERLHKDTQGALGAKKPWLVGERLDQLQQVFEDGVQETLLALLSEYPFLAGELSSAGTGRYRLDPEHQLMATAADIAGVQAFLREL